MAGFATQGLSPGDVRPTLCQQNALASENSHLRAKLIASVDGEVEGGAVPMVDACPIGVATPDADLEAGVIKSGLAGTRAAGAREEAHSKAGPNCTGMPNSDRAGAPLGDRLKAGQKSTVGDSGTVGHSN